MTDREKLVSWMLQGDIEDEVSENTTQHREYIADHLLANGVVVREWIPVTERLPVDWCPVLVMVREVGEPLLGSYRENVWFHERWNTTFIDGAVTHWMPLPEPPKEGE